MCTSAVDFFCISVYQCSKISCDDTLSLGLSVYTFPWYSSLRSLFYASIPFRLLVFFGHSSYWSSNRFLLRPISRSLRQFLKRRMKSLIVLIVPDSPFDLDAAQRWNRLSRCHLASEVMFPSVHSLGDEVTGSSRRVHQPEK